MDEKYYNSEEVFLRMDIRKIVREEVAYVTRRASVEFRQSLGLDQPMTANKYLDPSNPLAVELYEFRNREAEDAMASVASIMGNRTIYDIVAKMPRNRDELLDVWGIGDKMAGWYGDTLLRIIDKHRGGE